MRNLAQGAIAYGNFTWNLLLQACTVGAAESFSRMIAPSKNGYEKKGVPKEE